MELLNRVKVGDLEILKILLSRIQEKNPVINFRNGAKSTVLHEAAFYGHANITIWYKEVVGLRDINPLDNKGNTPLMWAINQNQSDVVKSYIDSDYVASSKIFKYSIQAKM